MALIRSDIESAIATKYTHNSICISCTKDRSNSLFGEFIFDIGKHIRKTTNAVCNLFARPSVSLAECLERHQLYRLIGHSSWNVAANHTIVTRLNGHFT